MVTSSLNYNSFGHIFISEKDDCNAIVDAMLAVNYSEDFCIAESFAPEFIARLMEAGFLVMSMNLHEDYKFVQGVNPFYFLMPRLHTVRSALFFENLHVKKSIRRLLNRYELRPNVEFDRIIDRCIEKHGSAWLTPPLVEVIKKLRRCKQAKVSPFCFGLYRGGSLVAGEFGIVCGKVYTSYSGFYDESNAGTVQLILATQYLQEQGFLFFDLGMPLDYKTELGAVDIDAKEFVRLFRRGTDYSNPTISFTASMS